MKKRSSQKKLNGEILLMQTELMSKLNLIAEPKKEVDELGFAVTTTSQPDALLDLISKSKNITQQHKKQIEIARKSQSKKSLKGLKEGEGTFLTGTGVTTELYRRKNLIEDSNELSQPSDPNDMLKDLIRKKNGDDLQELRKLIKQTSSNLEGCSKKLNNNKKSILHAANRYTREMSVKTLNFLKSYEEFQSKKMDDQDYLRRY